MDEVYPGSYMSQGVIFYTARLRSLVPLHAGGRFGRAGLSVLACPWDTPLMGCTPQAHLLDIVMVRVVRSSPELAGDQEEAETSQQ